VPIPQKDSPYARPHPHLQHFPWEPWAKTLKEKLLSWNDVKQMTVFGRMGYYLNNYLFASLPLQEPLLEVWVRLSDADAVALVKDGHGARHEHGVPGWMKYRLDQEGDVTAAAQWLERAYNNAVGFWREGAAKSTAPKPEGANANPLGVPIDLVPEATGKPAHLIPQGPRSGEFITGLAVEGAAPQPGKARQASGRPHPRS